MRPVIHPIALPVVALATASCGHPPDASIQAQFSRHRSEFESVVQLAKDDSNLWRITPTWFRTNYDGNHYAPSDGSLSKDRWNQYRTLFTRLGLDDGISIENGNIFFEISNVGMVGSGSTKGIVYAASPDRFKKENADLRLIELSANWFLFETSN
jgi:hypothetical protein